MGIEWPIQAACSFSGIGSQRALLVRSRHRMDAVAAAAIGGGVGGREIERKEGRKEWKEEDDVLGCCSCSRVTLYCRLMSDRVAR
jgi:hypothetical protein